MQKSAILLIIILLSTVVINAEVTSEDTLINKHQKTIHSNQKQFQTSTDLILSEIEKNTKDLSPKKFLGISISTFASFFLSLVVTLIGVFLALICPRKYARNRHINFYKKMISSLIDSAKIQAQNLDGLIALLDQPELNDSYPLTIKCDFSFNYINNQPLDIITERIIKNKASAELLVEFFSKLSILESVANRFITDYENMNESITFYKRNMNKSLKEIRELFDHLLSNFVKNGKIKEGDSFFDKFREIFLNCFKERRLTKFEENRNFIYTAFNFTL